MCLGSIVCVQVFMVDFIHLRPLFSLFVDHPKWMVTAAMVHFLWPDLKGISMNVMIPWNGYNNDGSIVSLSLSLAPFGLLRISNRSQMLLSPICVNWFVENVELFNCRTGIRIVRICIECKWYIYLFMKRFCFIVYLHESLKGIWSADICIIFIFWFVEQPTFVLHTAFEYDGISSEWDSMKIE